MIRQGDTVDIFLKSPDTHWLDAEFTKLGPASFGGNNYLMFKDKSGSEYVVPERRIQGITKWSKEESSDRKHG